MNALAACFNEARQIRLPGDRGCRNSQKARIDQDEESAQGRVREIAGVFEPAVEDLRVCRENGYGSWEGRLASAMVSD
jgi:hypothetical protein